MKHGTKKSKDPKEMVTCKYCGRQFEEYKSNHRQYCNKHCHDEHQKTERPKCKICGNPVKEMRNIYCSKKCANVDKGLQPRGVKSYSGLYFLLHNLYPNPEPCVICGEEGEHRHHPDYNKPLEIVWLCESCHHKLHKRNEKWRNKPVYIDTTKIKRHQKGGYDYSTIKIKE